MLLAHAGYALFADVAVRDQDRKMGLELHRLLPAVAAWRLRT
jgi:hypothetical protein